MRKLIFAFTALLFTLPAAAQQMDMDMPAEKPAASAPVQPATPVKPADDMKNMGKGSGMKGMCQGMNMNGMDKKPSADMKDMGSGPEMKGMSMKMEKPAGGPSTSLKLTVDGKDTTLTLADLATLPHKYVTIHNPHTKTDESYSGVPLAALLAAHGAIFDKSTEKKMLTSYIVATSTDGYSVIYSTVEVYPDYHAGDIIVADQMNGKPLDAHSGALKLVSTQDAKAVRWVRNLSSVRLMAPCPMMMGMM